MQNRLPNNPSYSSRYKTDFLWSKTFQSIQNRLPTVQALPVDTKLTSSGPRHSSRYKTEFLQTKSLQLIQNRLPPVQAIPVDAKTYFQQYKPLQSIQILTSSGPSCSRWCKNWLPTVQAIPVDQSLVHLSSILLPQLISKSHLVYELFSSCFPM